MGNVKGVFCLAAMLLVLGRSLCWGQSAPPLPNFDTRARAADPRLDLPLTFDADRMYLGELLEKVSAQTGVSLSIPPTDLGSGIPITCHLKKIPLAEFMNAVWSLVGYSKATWQITPDARQKSRSYQLLPTTASRTIAERLLRENEQDTARLFNLYLKLAAMTGAERRTHVHELAEAMLLDKDDIAAGFVQDMPGLDEYWSMVHLFSTELTPDQQNQALQGTTVSVPFNSLSAEGQDLLRQVGSHSHTTLNGVPQSNVPDAVQFGFGQYNSVGDKQMMKKLYISVVTGSGAMTSDHMGIMERGLQSRIHDGWILPGDLPRKEVQKQIANALPAFPEESLWRHVDPFDLLLAQIAEAQNFSYIGIVPEAFDSTSANGHSHSFSSSAPPVPLSLDDQGAQRNLMYKWRDGVLLFSYPLWFYGDDTQYPYATVKQLRESRKGHADGSPLTLPEIADAVLTLTDVQMQRLAKEFPQVENNKTRRPLFRFYKRYPGILSEEGMAVDLKMLALLKESKLMPFLAENDSLERMRIIEKGFPQITDGRRLYRIQFQTAQRKTWQEGGTVSILPNRKE